MMLNWNFQRGGESKSKTFPWERCGDSLEQHDKHAVSGMLTVSSSCHIRLAKLLARLDREPQQLAKITAGALTVCILGDTQNRCSITGITF